MVLDASELETFASILEEYESVAEDEINTEMSVNLQLGN